MRIRAIDISYAQGSADLKRSADSGVKAVIIRSGYLGKTDDRFFEHMESAAAAKLDIGIYTYLISETPEQAVREALETAERLERYKGLINYPVFCDMEDGRYLNGDRFTKKSRTDILVSFCETIRKSGWYPAVYINPAWLEGYVDKSRVLGKYDIWLAAWTGSPDKLTRYDYGQTMWQWGAGSVPGIKGLTDGDTVYVDYPKIIKDAGKNFLTREEAVSLFFKAESAAPIRAAASDKSQMLAVCGRGRLYPVDRMIESGGRKWLRHAWINGWSEEGRLTPDGRGYILGKTTDRLNVRAKPSASAEITGRLEKNADVFVADRENGWLKIVYFGREAYVFGEYVELTGEAEGERI